MRKMIWVAILFCSTFLHASQPTTILLVRHAEKSTTPQDDPVLTDAGKARAQELARVAGQAGIQALYSSQYARTRMTAEILGQHFSLPVQQVDAAKTNDLVSDVMSKHAGQTVLIVAHSNTMPEILKAFGGPEMADPEDDEYDNLWVIFVYEPGKAKLVRLKYGEHWK